MLVDRRRLQHLCRTSVAQVSQVERNVTARDRTGRTACHLDLDAEDSNGQTPRQQCRINPEQVESARKGAMRHRSTQVCIGLQSLRLDALQLCEILQLSCGPLARLIAFCER
jgi:hypothetical protein